MKSIVNASIIIFFCGLNSFCQERAVPVSENISVSTGSLSVQGGSTASQAKQNILLRTPFNLIHIPKVRQATDYTCCVAALQAVLGYYGEDRREDQLARELKPHPEYGTNIRNMEKAALARGFAAQRKLNVTLDELKKSIDSRQPVILLVQAWPDKPVLDYSADWEDGHCVVGIGYDSDNLYVMDPSVLGNYAFIPIPEFMTRWHDVDGEEKVSHLMLSIYGKPPKYDADAFLYSK